MPKAINPSTRGLFTTYHCHGARNGQKNLARLAALIIPIALQPVKQRMRQFEIQSNPNRFLTDTNDDASSSFCALTMITSSTVSHNSSSVSTMLANFEGCWSCTESLSAVASSLPSSCRFRSMKGNCLVCFETLVVANKHRILIAP